MQTIAADYASEFLKLGGQSTTGAHLTLDVNDRSLVSERSLTQSPT
jgi:hypothetical protein